MRAERGNPTGPGPACAKGTRPPTVFVIPGRASECTERLICAGTNVALCIPVDPFKPNDAKPADVTIDIKLDDLKLDAAPNVEPTDPKRPGSGMPVILVAIVGVVAGMVTMFAVVATRTTAAHEPARPTTAPSASPAPVVEEGPVPTWTGSKRAGWANDGSKTIAFTLASTRDLPVWMNRARPALIVRCLSRVTEAFVMLETSTSFEQDANLRTVRVQWDDDATAVQQWTVSETARELFAPDGVAFVRRMASAKRLRFGFAPFNAEPVTAEFAVEGFDKLAGLVASTCGWRFDDRTSS